MILYSDVNGIEKEMKDIEELEVILDMPIEYWKGGGGDSSIKISQEGQLIFFRMQGGYFIMFHPDYLSPLISNGEINYLIHYVGGQAMKIPSVCLCSKEQAVMIFKDYIENEGLLSEFQWVDIYEFEE